MTETTRHSPVRSLASALTWPALLLGAIASASAQPPSLVWAVNAGGPGTVEGRGISVDGAGNVYVTGPFGGVLDFDPGPGTFNLASAGLRDAFVQKLDPNGNFLWAVRTGGPQDVQSFRIATDAAGNAWTTGFFNGTVDFDPGPATFNLTSGGQSDAFVQKLDPAGNFVWAVRMGGIFLDNGWAITLDAAGNVYTGGSFGGTVDFDPGPGVLNLTGRAFVQKLDPAGNLVWAVSWGAFNPVSPLGIALDGSGNVHTTGAFLGSSDFDPGAGTFNLSSLGIFDAFVQKLDPSGNFLWAVRLGGAGNDGGSEVSTDSLGNVYSTGRFSGSADFDPGPGTTTLTSNGFDDIFVSKLDAGGNFLWAAGMGGTTFDDGLGIATDATGDVYTTGVFSGPADFDPGAGIFNLGGSGIFAQKLDTNGNFVWAVHMGNSTVDEGEDITLDALGNVYTTGNFSGSVDFDPGPGVFNLTSSGCCDLFVQKLGPVMTTDADGDGVTDLLDVCAGTTIPEAMVPSVRLGVNRWALVDSDTAFDTTAPRGGGKGPQLEFTVDDTGGCSCEQIIDALGLGTGHVKFGCSISAMEGWVALVNP